MTKETKQAAGVNHLDTGIQKSRRIFSTGGTKPMKTLRGYQTTFIAIAILIIAQGCALHPCRQSAAQPGITEAIAIIHPTPGNTVTGIVRFTKTADGITILADIEGLPPNTKHGFHIHEFGDFSSPDATSAGGHYNPEGHKHGSPSSPECHAGDLGNLTADNEGKAHLLLHVNNITIAGSRNPIIGRGLVIHAAPDDFVTQPTGNAGARIGFGVIGIAKPRM